MTTIMTLADPGSSTMDEGSIFVYAYNDEYNWFYLLQEVHLENVVWVELVSYNTDLLLVAVAEDVHGDQGSMVILYRMDWFSGDGVTPLDHLDRVVGTAPTTLTSNMTFILIQELEVELPTEAHFTVLPSGDLNLYVMNRNGLLTWFTRMGMQRFRKAGELHVPGKLRLEVWLTRHGHTVVHRLSVAGQSCSDSTQDIPELPGEVLEMRFRPWK
ncbi:uncharacterized protein LOC121868194 [Homarus americanus]|uniref:Uncharacterized protein n=1 Tax=Homarus americanus TaxID=6706 RepID=A0A8J5MXR5_HOMAM|nr:uncharacterized protein LOC121868194 [Homarus americanus]KAG7167481.1 hypothetical protein Hamer_G012944 [Homarus americanus]